jgi:hypothetical protein
MTPMGLEPKVSAGEWPLTYTLGRAATGTGLLLIRGAYLFINVLFKVALHNSE